LFKNYKNQVGILFRKGLKVKKKKKVKKKFPEVKK